MFRGTFRVENQEVSISYATNFHLFTYLEKPLSTHRMNNLRFIETANLLFDNSSNNEKPESDFIGYIQRLCM